MAIDRKFSKPIIVISHNGKKYRYNCDRSGKTGVFNFRCSKSHRQENGKKHLQCSARAKVSVEPEFLVSLGLKNGRYDFQMDSSTSIDALKLVSFDAHTFQKNVKKK